jgi:threonine/homoserine/homoserine lactone efflux protein
VACAAGVGRLLAFVVMIALAATGLAMVLQTSAILFLIIKTLGAMYLLYVAWGLWHAKVVVDNPIESKQKAPIGVLIRQEFWMAAGNPKAILIFTAFLPQFVDTALSTTKQFAVLGLLFLALEWIAIAIYALLGSYLKQWFDAPKRKRVFNRCCASLLASAGVGLLFLKKQ